jgi:hypothetical protein
MAEFLFRRGGPFWQDKLRAYRILIDGKECATIKQSSEVRVPVTSGRHKVQLRIDWCASPSLEIMAVNEGIETIECGPNSKPWLALFYGAFLRNKYIWIKHQTK